MFNWFKQPEYSFDKPNIQFVPYPCSHEWHDAGGFVYIEDDEIGYSGVAYCPKCRREEKVSKARMHQLLRITDINKKYAEREGIRPEPMEPVPFEIYLDDLERELAEQGIDINDFNIVEIPQSAEDSIKIIDA